MKRGVDDEAEGVEMAGVEHLGQYVFEMTQARIRQLKEGVPGLLPPQEEVEGPEADTDGEGDDDEVEEGLDDIEEE